MCGLRPAAMNRITTDAVALISLVILTGFFAWRFVDFSIPPFEDAAILMRYAEHLAAGKGIVWNPGEPPVDGATDFLFLLAVAAVHGVGCSLECAVRLLTLLAHFGTTVLIYIGMRRIQGAGMLPALLSATYFTVGPGLFFAAAYFGTPFFAFSICLAWLLAQRLLVSTGTTRDFILFSIVCLTTGLIRPEGVFISIYIMIALGLLMPWAEYRRLASIFCSIFLALGGAYFLWRWSYFGYPLPNPFYKKGGGFLHYPVLEISFRNSYVFLYPFIPAFLLTFRKKELFLKGLAFLIPIVGSIVMWVMLSDEMNFGARFQYPVLVLGVLSWFPLVSTLREDLHLPTLSELAGLERIALIIVALLFAGMILRRQVIHSTTVTYAKDGRYDIAVMLHRFADRKYTMATTEAGLLPLYSKWRAIDTWGLNDQWIAHHGLVTKEYLDRNKPDLLVWHGYFSPFHPVDPGLLRSPWGHQTLVLYEYAKQYQFTPAGVFGMSPQDTHCYYVRPGIPDHDELVRLIRSLDYAWYENGGKSTNFALTLPGHGD